MPQIIDIPGQGHVEFPDGMSDEQISAAIKKMGPTEPSILDRAKNAVGDVTRGVGKGLDSMGRTIVDTVGSRFLGTQKLSRALPQTQQLVEDRVPTGPVDRYAKSALEGVGGAAAGGGITPMGLASGATSGVGQEAARQALGGGPLQETLGSVLGGLLPMLLSAGKNASNAPALARKTIENVPEAQLDAARARMVEAKGVLPAGINLSQAMGTPSNIDDVVAALARDPKAGAVTAQLRAQPEQLRVMGTMATGTLPGERQSPQMIANRGQDAATGAITEARRDLSGSVDQLYRQAPALPKTAAQTLSNVANKARFEPGATPEFIAAAKVLEDQLAISPRTGAPTSSAQDVHSYIQSFAAKARDADGRTGFQMKELSKKMYDALGNASPETGLANTVYASGMANTVNPLKKSVVGQIAGVAGSSDDRAAAGSQLKKLLDQGTPDPKNSSILAFETATRKSDPTIFTDAVKSNIADKWDAIVTPVNGRVPEDLAARIQKTFVGTPAQEQGLRDQLAGVARSQGVPPAPLVKGFMNFIRASQLSAKTPSSVTNMAAEGVNEVAGASKVAGVLTSLTPGRAGGKITDWFAGGAKAKIDSLLTTPEGLDTLRELAKVSPTSERAQILLGTFFGGVGASQPNPTQLPAN